ncbi:MAG TPA: hypothetical protein VIX86_25390 [Streptosporangiaceae bacterium]
MKFPSWSAAPVAAVATVLLVAACGPGSSSSATGTISASAGVSTPTAQAPVGKPPANLAKLVNSAVAKATSVHLAASVAQGGKQVSMSVSMTPSGGMYGQMSLGSAALVILVTQGHTYLKITKSALQSQGLPAAACVLMCGKYLELTHRQSRQTLAGTSWSSYLGTSGSVPVLTYVTTVTVNGQPAWEMRGPGGETIDVAAQGPPYPLRITKGGNHLDFSQWNTATIPPPPPASEVVSLSQLSHL